MPKGSKPPPPMRLRCAAVRRAFPTALPGVSFRTWVRQEFGKRSREQLSPKLARIVHGGA